jgi:alanine dehydrogenase
MAIWLTEADVRAVLSMQELVDAIEGALIALSERNVMHPVRTILELAPQSFFAVMPAWFPQRAILGAKLVSVVPANAPRGIPTHLASISLFDAETGALKAIVDGRYITEVRTAAATAVSVRHMAREDARVLAILGSGVQARSHRAILPLVRDFREIRAWSPNHSHLAAFVSEAGDPVRTAESASDAVRDADVIVVVTNCITPAILNDWVKPGAHVAAVGSCRPTHQEVDPLLVARARVVVDSREAALREAGDLVVPICAGLFTEDHVTAELGEVAARRKPGRTSPAEVTLFKSLGQAVEDLVAAELAWQRAVERGLGTLLPD